MLWDGARKPLSDGSKDKVTQHLPFLLIGQRPWALGLQLYPWETCFSQFLPGQPQKDLKATAKTGKTGKPYISLGGDYRNRRSQLEAELVIEFEGKNPLDGIYFVELEHYFELPNNATSRERELASQYPFRESKPSLDDLNRPILDALAGKIIPDVSTIAGIQAVRLYGRQEGTQINVFRSDRQQPWHTNAATD